MLPASQLKAAASGIVLLTNDGSLHHFTPPERVVKNPPGAQVPSKAVSVDAHEDESAPQQTSSRFVAKPATLSSAIFEKCACVTSKIKITADLSARPPAYDASRKVNSAPTTSKPLVSAHMDHLRLTLHNNNPDLCVMGVLVLVGEAYPDHIPTEIHLCDRYANVCPCGGV